MNNILKFCLTFLVTNMHITSFGMDQNTFIQKEFLQQVAVFGDNHVKNKLRNTCKYFRDTICKNNPCFVNQLQFSNVHPMDARDIVLYFSWRDRLGDIEPFAKQIPSFDKIPLWPKLDHLCGTVLWPRSFDLDSIKKNKAFIGSKNTLTLMDQQIAELVLLYAALCNDEEVVKTIAQKMKTIGNLKIRSASHNLLLTRLTVCDDERIFKVVAKEDPYGVLNSYQYNDSAGIDDFFFDDNGATFLDDLIKRSKRDEAILKYVEIYKKCGGKPFAERQAEERKDCNSGCTLL